MLMALAFLSVDVVTWDGASRAATRAVKSGYKNLGFLAFKKPKKTWKVQILGF